ncbi:MAG: DUF952 domain-containing protein [Aestuariivirga sp.]
MPLLYKICSAAEWTGAQAAGNFQGSDIYQVDGFIHLSAARWVRPLPLANGRHVFPDELAG